MAQRNRLADLFEGKRSQKIVLTVAVLALLLLELLIYVAAAGQAGEKSRVIVTDHEGRKVYETTGGTLSSYERMVFESTFGPLEGYRLHVETEKRPFPFRAWLTAAVGIPMGLILLIAFAVKVFMTLLYGEDGGDPGERGPQGEATAGRFGSVLHAMHRVSVLHFGLLVVLGLILFWMVPNFIEDFGRVAAAFLVDHKWFLLATAGFAAFLIIWVIYLRYRLSRQMLDHQYRIEKLRIEHQALVKDDAPTLLTQTGDQASQGN